MKLSAVLNLQSRLPRLHRASPSTHYPYSVAHIFQASADALIRTPIEHPDYLGEQDESAESAVGEMSFTGPVFVGGPNITLVGSPKNVYHEIIKRNPDYDAWDFPDYAEEMALEGITCENFNSTHPPDASLAKRGSKMYDCQAGKLVERYTQKCSEGLRYLESIGSQWCVAPRMERSRVSCSHGCGMFLFNNLLRENLVRCGKIASEIKFLSETCGRKGNMFPERSWVAQGRSFHKYYYVELSKDVC